MRRHCGPLASGKPFKRLHPPAALRNVRGKGGSLRVSARERASGKARSLTLPQAVAPRHLPGKSPQRYGSQRAMGTAGLVAAASLAVYELRPLGPEAQ